MYKGIPAAPGIAIGRVVLLDSEDYGVVKQNIKEEDLAKEVVRFEAALINTRHEILNIQKNIAEEMGDDHAEIFNAHLLVLEDRSLIDEVILRLKKEKICVEYIFAEILKKYIRVFSKMKDEYLKERVTDIDDVGRRVLRNLLGKQAGDFKNLKLDSIVVGYDLSPSDTATINRDKVVAFVTDIGSRTSHTAIMAKSLEIPAVVGLEEITRRVKRDDLLIVDGTNGIVIVNPNRRVLSKYIKQKQKYHQIIKNLSVLKDLPAETLDGCKVELSANIEFPDEIPSVIAHGADGIGLYRTEYFYMNIKDLPTEEEHFQAYKKVTLQVAPHFVVIRTLDLGGDKFLSPLKIPHEMNPFMGWRAIRFCLARTDIFKTQLAGILRASAYGNIKIMYPMISGLEELKEANQILEDVKRNLKSKKIKFNENIEVGAMIEVPSAAIICDILAKEVNFFSIGTNDLIQYALAVDRINEKIAYLYKPTHPAVLRLVKNIIDTGHKNGLWVGMCGEMAGEPTLTLILLGLGLDEFSTSPANIPQVKQIIRSVKIKDAENVVKTCLEFDMSEQVEDYANKKLKELTMK